MIGLSIIALVLVLLIPSSLIIFLRFVSKRLTVKSNFIFIGAYIGVLIVLSFMTLLLPSVALINGSTKGLSAVNNPMGTLYQNITAGNFGEIGGLAKNAEYSFAAKGSITFYNNDVSNSNGVSEYVGVKGVDAPDNGDGKIDVYCYTSSYNFSGTYVTLKVPAPKVSFCNNQLKISASQQTTADFYSFDDKLTNPENINDTINSEFAGCQMIVVMLPHGVTVSGTGYQTLQDLNVTIEG